jgi:hypothetical protein
MTSINYYEALVGSSEIDLKVFLVGVVILASLCWNSSTVLDQVSYVFMILAPPLVFYHAMQGDSELLSYHAFSYYTSAKHNALPWYFETVCLATLFGYVVKLPQLFYTTVRLLLWFGLLRQISAWNVVVSRSTLEQLYLDPFHVRPTIYESVGMYFSIYFTVLQPEVLTNALIFIYDVVYSRCILPYKRTILSQQAKEELEVVIQRFGSDVGRQIYTLRTAVSFIGQMEVKIKKEFKTKPVQTPNISRYDQLTANIFRHWADLQNQIGQEYLERVIIDNIVHTIYTKPSIFEMMYCQDTSHVVHRHWSFVISFWKHKFAMERLMCHLEDQLPEEAAVVCDDNRRGWEYAQRIAVIVFKSSTLCLMLSNSNETTDKEKQKQGFEGLVLVLNTFLYVSQCTRLALEEEIFRAGTETEKHSKDLSERLSYHLELSKKKIMLTDMLRRDDVGDRASRRRNVEDIRTLLNEPNCVMKHILHDLTEAGWNGF